MREAEDSSSHLSDQELVMALDGELPPRDSSRVEAHLTGCWTCRSRKMELERAIAGLIDLQQQLSRRLPPAEGPRALLKAQLARMAPLHSMSWWQAPLSRRAAWIAAVACGLALVWTAVTRWIPASRPAATLALAVP